MADARDATSYIEVAANTTAESRDATTYLEVTANTTPAFTSATAYVEVLTPVATTAFIGWGSPT